LKTCIKNISIWAKHLPQQLTVLLEKQQWMSVIAKMLPTIDIAQSNLRFLFNVAVYFLFIENLGFSRVKKFLLPVLWPL